MEHSVDCMNTVAVRVDSSTVVGSGHLMRCLTLAQRLRKNETAQIHFIARDLDGNLNHLIRERGFELNELPRHPADTSLTGYGKWLTVPQAVDAAETIEVLRALQPVEQIIIDSYAIDIEWEAAVRPFVKKIFVIDDLANRRHDCDVLLDQAYNPDSGKDYSGLVPPHCELQLGLKYALIREEFYEVKSQLRRRDGSIKNVLVFYGGSDLTNETTKALNALISLNVPDLVVNVVVGGSNVHRNEIERLCREYDFIRCHYQIDNMAELMNEADLALGAGGTTALERCFLGLPSIITAVADNQVPSDKNIPTAGYFVYLGRARDCTVEDIVRVIKNLGADDLLRMQKKCLEIWE